MESIVIPAVGRDKMTLEEVAKRAGVSTATVSRVLNGTGLVKEATRKTGPAGRQGLKYHPNLHARTLARGKSRTIGMIVSNIENPFFLDIFTSLESAASKAGYSVLVEHTDYRSARLVASVRSMLGRNLAGLAAIVSEMDPSLIEELSERDLPIAFYDVGHPAANITSIKVQYEIGMQRTIEYLYSLRSPAHGVPRPPRLAWTLAGAPRHLHRHHAEARGGRRVHHGGSDRQPGGRPRRRPASCWPRASSRPPFCARTTSWRSAC